MVFTPGRGTAQYDDVCVYREMGDISGNGRGRFPLRPPRGVGMGRGDGCGNGEGRRVWEWGGGMGRGINCVSFIPPDFKVFFLFFSYLPVYF